MRKSNKLTQTQRKKYKLNIMMKKERTQKTELRAEWKGTGEVYKKEENWQEKEEKE